MDDDAFLSIKAASERTGIPVRTLHYYISSGKLPYSIAKHRQRGRLVRLQDIGKLRNVSASQTGDFSATANEQVQYAHEEKGEGEAELLLTRRSNINSNALISHLEQMYRETIDAKDALIASRDSELQTKDALIAELQKQLALLGDSQHTKDDQGPREKDRPWWQFWKG